jgi:hypothetical protein
MSFWKTALTGLAGGLGPGLFSLGSDLLSNRGAKSRQNLANKQNVEFWNMQNAYNTPKQQMSRLKDAGLNPNLIYGSNANTGVAGSIAPSKASPYNVQNPVPLQTMLLGAQIKNLNSVTSKNNAETKKTLGLTSSLIGRSEKQLQIATEKAFQEGIKSGQIEDQEVAKTKSLVNKAMLDFENQSYRKVETDFKKGLIKMGVSPDGNFATSVLKLLTQGFKIFLESKNTTGDPALDTSWIDRVQEILNN